MTDLAAVISALAAWKWAIVTVVALFVFRRDISDALGRLRRGTFSYRKVSLDLELNKLEEKAANADAASQELPPARAPKAVSSTAESSLTQEVLVRAAESPKAALMLLASDIERELRELLAATGWPSIQHRTSVPASIEHAASATALPQSVREAVQQFWPVRNRLVHGRDVSDDDILRGIDAGLLILKSISAIPREANVVHHPGADVFSDPAGKALVPKVRALILETTKSDSASKILRVYPTTRTGYYERGKKVAWEWNPVNQYDECWYRDPDSGKIKYGWTSSFEFVGRHLDDVQ